MLSNNAANAGIPPNVLFAQKASAVVKAAGMDPRLLDLEKFRSLATVIFTYAYQAIYKEEIIVNDEEVDQYHCQAVIDGLYRRTENTVLNSITGGDVCKGSHKAIGILVGILFAEGQRLWLEKKKQQHDDNDNHAEATIVNHKKHRKLKKSAAGAEVSRQPARPPSHEMKLLEAKAVYVTSTASNIRKNLYSNRIANRIAYLKSKLDQINYKGKDADAAGASFAGIDTGIADIADDEVILNSNSHSGSLPTKKKRRSRKKSRKLDKFAGDDILGIDVNADETTEPYYNDYNGHGINDKNDTGSGQKLKMRPSSAPTRRRRVNTPSKRLYNPPRPRDDTDVIVPTSLGDANTVEDEHSAKEFKYVSTYDVKTGHRKIMSEADYTSWNKQRIDEYEQEKEELLIAPTSSYENYSDKPYTKPMWPGHRTGMSAEEWIKRQKLARDIDHGIVSNTATDTTNMHSRHLNAYSKLKDRDFAISIEHCHNCEYHNMTLRHKASGYTSHADATLKSLAYVVHASCASVRLGVIRFEANVTPRSRETDTHCRIGAFEIQVAYRNSKGEVFHELLHSKLANRKWPAKMVLEKRLKTFIAKLKIPTFSTDERESGNYGEVGSDGLSSYPIGVGPFSDTPLGDAMWCYPVNTNSSVKKGPCASDTVSNIQWVFDSRSNTAFYPIGSTVRIANINHPRGGKERNDLIGIVKGYPVDTSQNVEVCLKYHTSNITVPLCDCKQEDDCISIDYDTPSNIPSALAALHLLSQDFYEGSDDGTSLIPWKIMNTDDKLEDSHKLLSRTSYFHQLRSVVWDIETKLSKASIVATHPKTKQVVDLQLAYSEEAVDWVFHMYGKYADVDALWKLIIPIEPLASALSCCEINASVSPRSTAVPLVNNSGATNIDTKNSTSIDIGNGISMPTSPRADVDKQVSFRVLSVDQPSSPRPSIVIANKAATQQEQEIISPRVQSVVQSVGIRINDPAKEDTSVAVSSEYAVESVSSKFAHLRNELQNDLEFGGEDADDSNYMDSFFDNNYQGEDNALFDDDFTETNVICENVMHSEVINISSALDIVDTDIVHRPSSSSKSRLSSRSKCDEDMNIEDSSIDKKHIVDPQDDYDLDEFDDHSITPDVPMLSSQQTDGLSAYFQGLLDSDEDDDNNNDKTIED